MEPSGHVLFGLTIGLLTYKKLGKKSIIVAVIASTIADWFLPLKAYAGLEFPQYFMHTLLGFIVTLLVASLIIILLSKSEKTRKNYIILFFVGISSHFLFDYIEGLFPQSVVNVLGFDFHLSLMASVISFVLCAIFLLLREIS